MTIEEIERVCNFSHTSLKRGYISRKGSQQIIKEYIGKFGNGITVETANWESTGYHYITYYIYK